MSGFQGSDVDALDQIAGWTKKAADFATLVAGVLEAVATALEAFSWTGWAAAFARYLRTVVIPWVRSAAKMLSSASQFLALMSGKQKDASGDTPQVSTGSTPGYQVPRLPTVSTGDAPQVAAITITFGSPGASAGSTGVQVTPPSLTGTGPVVPGQVVGSTGAGATVTVPAAALTGALTGGGLARGGLAGGALTGAALARETTGGLSSGGGSGSGLGYRTPSGAGALTGSGDGVADTALGGGTGGGNGTSSGLFTAGSGASGSFDRTLPATPSDQGDGPGAAVLAAPLGVLGLGAAALSAHAARTATQTPESDGGSVQDDGSTTA